MASKCLDHCLGGKVPQSGGPVPGRSDSLTTSSHPVRGHNDPGVASEHHQGRYLPSFPPIIHLYLLVAPLLLAGMSKPSTLTHGAPQAPHMCSPISTACYHEVLARVELDAIDATLMTWKDIPSLM